MIKSVSGQYNVCKYLEEHKHIGFSAKDLSKVMDINVQSISVSLKKLYKSGLIKKQFKLYKGKTINVFFVE